jgi:Raf kinase inhibitor-like YbhB/YbcL family protein
VFASLVLAAGVALMACGGGAATPRATEGTMTDFTLTSSAFPPGGAMPSRFTCDGDDVSPDLAWSGAPDGSAAFALIVDDPDANDFLHWAVLDFAGSDSGALPAGYSESVDASQQATNDFGRVGWGGPCPPSGSHTYRVRLYALDGPLALAGAPTSREVRDAFARATILGVAELSGTYERVPQTTASR